MTGSPGTAFGSEGLAFGVFDHLDRNDLPLREFYAQRLALAELYDTAGFHAYHIAEHHSTPLGLASSPSVFLSALAQRTKRLRFGPLVYTLPLHSPLNLIEEVCMLDQLSGGRFEMGVGKGISPNVLYRCDSRGDFVRACLNWESLLAKSLSELGK